MKRVIISILLSMFLFACDSSDIPVYYAKPDSPLIPLAEGNRWEYKVVSNYSGEIDTFSSVIELSGSYNWNGYTWFTYAHDFWDLANLENGVYYRYTQPPIPDPAQLVYKYPTYKGEEYEGMVVCDTKRTIKIDIGIFETVVYRSKITKDEKNYHQDYVCPGIGIIKRERFNHDENGEYKLVRNEELVGFKLN